MERSHRSEGARLTRAGLITLLAGMLLLTSWALFPNQAQGALGNCPNQGDPGYTEIGGMGGTGGPVTVNGISFTWGEYFVTVSGAAGAFPVTFCVKAGNSFDVVTFNGPGTYTLQCPDPFECVGPTGAPHPPGISHILVSPSTTTTTTTTTTTGTTTTGTTTTGTTTTGTTTTGTTTSRAPTTVTPTDGTTSPGATTTSGGTAFTGIANVIPLGVLALSLMTAGSGLLWAGTRRSRRGEEE